MSAIELTTMQSSSLGERLHIARVHLGLTQEQVARRSGVSRGLISLWENGVVEAISAAARVLRVSLDWLLHGDGDGETQGSPDFDDETRRMLSAWSRLTASQRAGQLRIIRDLANHNQALLDELAGEL